MRKFATFLFLAVATFLVLSRGNFQMTLLVITTGTILLGLGLAFPLMECKERADVGWDLVGWLLTLVFIWTLSAHITNPAIQSLRQFESLRHYHQALAQVPPWMIAVGYLLVADFFNYWVHRALHGSLLWSTHAWHHSPTYLYWLAGSRTTIVHCLFIFVLPVLMANIVLPVQQARDYMGWTATIVMLNEQFVHTNLRVPFAKYIEYVFATPRFHFVHHSAQRRHSDSNYGSLFTFWDRLFGSYTDPDQLAPSYPLGLNYEIPKWRLIVGIPPAEPKHDVEEASP